MPALYIAGGVVSLALLVYLVFALLEAGDVPVTPLGYAQIVVFFAVLVLLVKPVGSYMARVHQHEPVWLEKALGPLERLLYRAAGVKKDEETSWQDYAVGMLLFNVSGIFLTYGIQRLQGILLLNPRGRGSPRCRLTSRGIRPSAS